MPITSVARNVNYNRNVKRERRRAKVEELFNNGAISRRSILSSEDLYLEIQKSTKDGGNAGKRSTSFGVSMKEEDRQQELHNIDEAQDKPPSRLSSVRDSVLSYSEPMLELLAPHRSKVKVIVDSKWFQELIVVLIVLNSIAIGIATFPFVTDSDYYTSIFEQIDLAFLITFTIEICLQLFVHGLKLFLDGWLVFDFLLILFSWAFSGITIIRSFRIFRALRLFARVGPLKKMVTAVTMTIPQLGAILAVFILVYAVFAIMLTQLYKDNFRDDFLSRYGEDTEHFSRLDLTLFTLFLVMTTDNWNDVVLFGDGTFQIIWYITIFFMIISNLVLLNLVIAVLCSTLTHLRISMGTKNDSNIPAIDPELAQWFSIHVMTLKRDVDDLISLNLSFAKTLRKNVPSVQINSLEDSELETKYMLPQKAPIVSVMDDKQYSAKSLSLISELSAEDTKKPQLMEKNHVRQLKDLRKNLNMMTSTMSLNITSEQEMADLSMHMPRDNDEDLNQNYSFHSDSSDSDYSNDRDFKSFREKTFLKIKSINDSSYRWLYEMAALIQAKASAIVYSHIFQTAIISLIFINSAMIGIGTFDIIYEDESRSNIFEVIDLIFLVIFTIELILQFIVHGIRLFTDSWLVFDFLTILLSWAFSGVSIIRSFRIFRAFRLFGRVKAMKQVLSAILSTGPQLVSICSVLFILCYIFAVLFTQLFRDVEFISDDDNYQVNFFGRLDYTFATLVMFLTFEGWSSVALSVMEVYSWAWIPLVSFLFIGAFMALNLVVAMICDSMTALEEGNIDLDKLSSEEYTLYVLEWISKQLQVLNSIMLSLFQVQLEVTSSVISNPLLLLPQFEEKYSFLREKDSLRQCFNANLTNVHDQAFDLIIEEDSYLYDHSDSESEAYPQDEDNRSTNACKEIQQRASTIVENDNFQKFIIFLIVVNSVFLGLGTFEWAEENGEIKKAFENVDFAFLIIFTVELVMQFLSKRFTMFRDNWLVFDFIIVAFSWSFSGVTIIRSFRIFRAFRLFGRIGPLKRTVSAITLTLGQVGAVGFLILVISYIFDVMLTSLFRDLYEQGYYDSTGIDYFGRLDYTAFTLLTFLTLDDWSDVVRLTQKAYWWAWIPMITYMTLTAIIVLNMIIAILCESITALRRDEEEGCRQVYKNQWEEAWNDETSRQKEETREFRDTLSSMITIQLAVSREFNVRRDDTDLSNNLEVVLEKLCLASKEDKMTESDYFNTNGSVSTGPRKSILLNEEPSDLEEGCSDIDDTYTCPGLKQFESFRLKLEVIALHDKFQMCMTSLIVLNSIMLGLSTFESIETNKLANSVLEVIDLILLIIFTVELVMNLIVFRKDFFRDAWLNFDLVIIFLSWAFSGVSIIRSFRIFRAFRLFGRIESLRITTTAMLSTGPEMTAIGLVLILLFYIFAVMFTQLFGDLYDEGYFEYNYFGRLDFTLLTCFMLTTLEKIDPISRSISNAYWWGWIPIFTFIVLISYVVLSLVVGAFCESIFQTRSKEREKQKQNSKSISRLAKLKSRKTNRLEEDEHAEIEAKLKDVNLLQRRLEEFESGIEALKGFQRFVQLDKSLVKEMAIRQQTSDQDSLTEERNSKLRMLFSTEPFQEISEENIDEEGRVTHVRFESCHIEEAYTEALADQDEQAELKIDDQTAQQMSHSRNQDEFVEKSVIIDDKHENEQYHHVADINSPLSTSIKETSSSRLLGSEVIDDDQKEIFPYVTDDDGLAENDIIESLVGNSTPLPTRANGHALSDSSSHQIDPIESCSEDVTNEGETQGNELVTISNKDYSSSSASKSLSHADIDCRTCDEGSMEIKDEHID